MNRSKTTTDHDEIRRWAEARGGKPTAVKGTARGKRDPGMIRIDFPGYSGEGKLVPISWDKWFETKSANKSSKPAKSAKSRKSRKEKLA
jgi:hypothetical protein